MNLPNTVLIAASSRSGRSTVATVRTLLSEHGADPETVVLCARKGEMEAHLEALESPSTVWVGGGDGTIRRVCELISTGGHSLGILPLGTGNAVARELEVPIKIEECVPWLLDAVPRKIDYGTCNGAPFVNMISCGITTRIASWISRMPKRKFGLAVYIPALWRAVHGVRPFHAKVHTVGSTFEGMAIQIVAASTRNHGALLQVTEAAAIDDGLLSIYVVGEGSRSDVFRFAVAVLQGRHEEMPQVWSNDVPMVNMEFDRPRTVIADGDKVAPCRTWELQAMPLALNVLAAPERAQVPGTL